MKEAEKCKPLAPVQVSILPPIAAIAVSAIAGPAADMLLERGVSTALVRKGAQCMAFLGPAACLAAASVVQDSPGSGPLLVGKCWGCLVCASCVCGLGVSWGSVWCWCGGLHVGVGECAAELVYLESSGVVGLALGWVGWLPLMHQGSWLSSLLTCRSGGAVSGAGQLLSGRAVLQPC